MGDFGDNPQILMGSFGAQDAYSHYFVAYSHFFFKTIFLLNRTIFHSKIYLICTFSSKIVRIGNTEFALKIAQSHPKMTKVDFRVILSSFLDFSQNW